MSESSRQDKRTAAFFDLDRTLIDVNSGSLYARFEYRNGRIKRSQFLQSAVWGLLYHLSLLNLESAFRRVLRHYVGVDEAELAERTRRWFEAEVAHRIQPGGRDALTHHRTKGEPVVLITNSSCYLAAEAARAWDLDAWLSNHFVVDEEGRLSGDFVPPLCYGEGKIIRAERWAAENSIDLDDSTFYTDSLSDLPMLERVRYPRVVNPDPRLRRRARREGWPVLDWTRPARGAASAGPAKRP